MSKWPMRFKMMSSSADFINLSEVNKAGIISLNRPKHLNTINRDMLSRIWSTLTNWESTKSLVIVKSDIDKVFCAGADVRELVESEFTQSTRYNRDLNSTNYCIGSYRIPYVAIIDGITMGVGAGLAMHGRYRVATEKTLFAMPETAIGLFTNCGAGHFLPKLPGHLGMYLGLTGNSLKGHDVFMAGLATHYCEHKRLGELEAALLNSTNSSEIEANLSTFCQGQTSEKSSLETLLQKVNKCFSGNSVEDIFDQLEKHQSDWSKMQLKILQAASPLSLKVTFRLLQAGRYQNLAECLKMETRICHRFLEDSDFYEGVRAKLIEKDNTPKWKHQCLKDVAESDVLRFLSPFDDTNLELKI